MGAFRPGGSTEIACCVLVLSLQTDADFLGIPGGSLFI